MAVNKSKSPYSPVTLDLPDFWPEWPGMESAKKLLAALADEQHPTQSVLFYGTEGCGCKSIALELAKTWICLKPIPLSQAILEPDEFKRPGACNECASCESFNREMHPDFLHIQPMPPSRIIRLSSISVTSKSNDEGSTKPPIQMFFARSPIRGRAKVVLIEDVDRMNEGAANAFLKTLEEPPPCAKIVMTTNRLGAIPATILSRCVCAACELPSPSELESCVEEIKDWEIALGQGSPENIHAMRKNPEIFSDLYQFALKLPSRSQYEAMAVADQFRKLAKEFDKTLQKSAAGSDLAAGRTREAHAKALGILGEALRAILPLSLKAIAEAHRRVEANGSFNLITDALFAELLSGNYPKF